MYRPRSSPYGDVYTIPTSTVDGIANRLYQEQRVREQQKLQQDKALDDEFAKNIAGVKSIDIPDITKAYNDFKQAHIALQKKGQKATPQDQMDVMVKKANAFSEIAASKEDKEYWATRAKDGKNNKRYNPNYQTVISEGLNTPTKNRKRDLDDDRLLYQYAMPNIDKWVLNAVGKGQEVPIEVGTDPNDPLKNKKEIYKTINPPNVFYNNFFNGIGASSDNEGFTRFMLDKAYTDEEKEKLKIAYAIKTQDPKFKKLYGEVEPFPASAANTELGQAVALKTMEAFVNLPIDKPIRTQSVNDTEAVMDKRRKEGMEDWKIKQQISDQYKRARIKLNNEGRMYEIDNVPLKLRTNSTTLPVVLGNDLGEVVDVTNWSSKELDDVLGADKNNFGIRNNKPFTVGDKQYIKITPEGFKFLDASGKVVAVEDKDVIINTNKRTQGLEKPVGTGKMEVRGNVPSKKVKVTIQKGEADDL